MRVSKWGNSLAIRIPAAVAEALDLREGDQVDVRVAGTREFDLTRDRSREEAIERLSKLRLHIPRDFKFDREEAHER